MCRQCGIAKRTVTGVRKWRIHIGAANGEGVS